jgi:hypothetical protein
VPIGRVYEVQKIIAVGTVDLLGLCITPIKPEKLRDKGTYGIRDLMDNKNT